MNGANQHGLGSYKLTYSRGIKCARSVCRPWVIYYLEIHYNPVHYEVITGYAVNRYVPSIGLVVSSLGRNSTVISYGDTAFMLISVVLALLITHPYSGLVNKKGDSGLDADWAGIYERAVGHRSRLYRSSGRPGDHCFHRRVCAGVALIDFCLQGRTV
jgi:hypothetical protein